MGSVLNGANLRVVWDDFICGFLVTRAVADLDHLSPGNIEQLMWLRSSFDCSGFSPKRPAGNLVFSDHFYEIRDKPPAHRG
jgi:hypothetical protein